MNIDLRNQFNDTLSEEGSEVDCSEDTQKTLNNVDIVFRIIYTIVVLTNYIIRTKNDETYYNDSEIKIILFSIILVLIGIQNCSIAFYPWVKNIRILIYITFIILMVFTALKDTKTLMFVQNKESDYIYKISEFFFYFILLPNLTSIVMFGVLIVIFIFFFLIMNFLAGMGLVRFRFNVGENRRHNNANIFKKKFLKKLKGSFYKENNVEDIEMKSLINEYDIKSDDIEKIEKALSCDNIPKIIKKDELLFIQQNQESANVCSICFSKFHNLSYVLELPQCKHVFHFKCVISWLETNPSCPCCRSDLLLYFQNLHNRNQT